MGLGWRGVLKSLRRIQPMGLVLIAGTTFLVVVNLAQFSTVEARGSIFFKALHHRESADILSEMWHEDASSSSRYAMFLALEYVAPGSDVLIAEEDSGNEEWFQERLYAFGDVQDLEYVEGSALALLGGVDPRPYIVESGPGGPRGEPWAIAIEGEVRTFLIVRWPLDSEDGYRWLLVDVNLLPEEAG